jgi:transglutaminase-like putative cysteine protease
MALAVVLAALLTALALMLSACDAGATGTTMGSTHPGRPRDNTPQILEVSQPGAKVVENDKARLDYSNASEGYVCVMSLLDDKKVKVLVDVAGTRYQYTIMSKGYFITIPLSQGSALYTVGVWEHITGDKYSAIFSEDLNVEITDEFKPFLYPSQYVNFSVEDGSMQISQMTTEGATSDVEAINGMYAWVTDNVVYDTDKAELASAGKLPNYLPKNSDTINTKTGICFDYAVLTASMLREQRIPVKLVIGYCGQAYHAWLQVYSIDSGKVVGNYSFDGNKWVQMDPTFDAGAKGVQDLSSFIGQGNNYQPMFYY